MAVNKPEPICPVCGCNRTSRTHKMQNGKCARIMQERSGVVQHKAKTIIPKDSIDWLSNTDRF